MSILPTKNCLLTFHLLLFANVATGMLHRPNAERFKHGGKDISPLPVPTVRDSGCNLDTRRKKSKPVNYERLSESTAFHRTGTKLLDSPQLSVITGAWGAGDGWPHPEIAHHFT